MRQTHKCNIMQISSNQWKPIWTFKHFDEWLWKTKMATAVKGQNKNKKNARKSINFLWKMLSILQQKKKKKSWNRSKQFTHTYFIQACGCSYKDKYKTYLFFLVPFPLHFTEWICAKIDKTHKINENLRSKTMQYKATFDVGDFMYATFPRSNTRDAYL